MAIYKRDIVDINLETGNIHRSFLKHSIGYLDQQADRFGIRTYRDGAPVDLSGVSVQGIFMPPQGSPISITGVQYTAVIGNEAIVVLPQACYNYDGQFTLAIKLVDSTNAITGTMRIIDGVVDNTHASGTVAPTSAVPTYQEILATYDAMVAATAATNASLANYYSDLPSRIPAGTYCIYNHVLYRCIATIASKGEWDSSYWTPVKLGNDVDDLRSDVNDSFAGYYSDLPSSIPVGTYCIYNNILYRCISPIASKGAWDATKWVEAKLANDTSDLKSAIDNFPDYLAPYQVFQNRLLTSGGGIIEYSDYSVAVCKIETNKLYRVVKVKGVPGQDGVRLGYSNTLYDGSTPITIGYKNSTTNVVEYYNKEYSYLYFNIKSVKTSEQVYNCYAYEIMEEQIDQLKTDISEVQGNIDKIDDITTLSLTKGYFINTAGTTVNYTLVEDSGFDDGGCAVADCQPGDEFVVWGTGGNGGRLWCFVASNGDVRDKEGANTARSNYTIKAPSNTAKLVFNSKSAGSLCIKKQPPANRLTNLENEDEFIKSKIFKKVTLSSDSGFATGKAWNIYTNDWYTTSNGAYLLLNADDVNNHVKIISCYLNGILPGVVFFSGEPSEENYIGYDNIVMQGSQTTTEATNIEVSIPEGTTHILRQTGYINSGTASFEIYDNVFQLIDGTAPVNYEVDDDQITFGTGYGATKISFVFGKGGVNQLPDFKEILLGETSLYSDTTDGTDWFAPFVVAAKNNIDGAHPSSKYFTGGRHNYNNAGGSGASATARNTSFLFYANGKQLSDGDSGSCSNLTITWINRVQAYNTSKEDGTGREVLEERHTLVYDGYSMECYTELVPLESITMEKWYGYQAFVKKSWPTVAFIGGVNRVPASYSAGGTSGNNVPNMMRCYSSANLLELEIDRSFDLGKGGFYSGTSGMFASGNKVYCFIIENHDLDENERFALRGWYRFRPNN